METVSHETTRLYYTDSKLYTTPATVLESGISEEGCYIITDQTIFHPQGGGQPNDFGTIIVGEKRLPVTDLKQVDEAIRHYYKGDEILSSQTPVVLEIDGVHRQALSRSHSAGHLLEIAVSELYGPMLEPFKGRHNIDASAVSFHINDSEKLKSLEFSAIQITVEIKLNELIQQALPLTLGKTEAKKRYVQFGLHDPLECGGTHVSNSSEIGPVKIRNVKKVKGDIQIGYDISKEDPLCY